jgi:hypothetical protein
MNVPNATAQPSLAGTNKGATNRYETSSPQEVRRTTKRSQQSRRVPSTDPASKPSTPEQTAAKQTNAIEARTSPMEPIANSFTGSQTDSLEVVA